MSLLPKKATLHQILSTIPVFTALFLSGVFFGWPPILLYHLDPARSTLWLTEQQQSWLAAVQQFGRLATTIPTGMIMDIVGRKYVILATGVVFLASWLLAFGLYTMEGLFVSNFLMGLAMGMSNTSGQMYTAEISSANFRGVLHAVNTFCFNLGLVFISLLGNYLAYRDISAIMVGCCVLYFLPLYWMVESPYYLLAVGSHSKAKKTLEWLRSGDPWDEIQKEFSKISTVVRDQKQITAVGTCRFIRPLTDPLNRKYVSLVLFLNSAAVFTGFLTIRLHSTKILSVTSLVHDTVRYPLMIAFVQLLCSIVSPLVIERFPRRTLYLFGCSSMSVVLAATAVLYYCKQDDQTSGTIALILILFYYIVYSTVVHSLLFITKGELLPQSIRATGSGLVALSQAISSILVILKFPLLKQMDGIYLNFVLYSVVSVLTGLVVYWYLPETRGLTLAAIQSDMTDEKDCKDVSVVPMAKDDKNCKEPIVEPCP